MKYVLLAILFSMTTVVWSQSKIENMIVITTDGFRWQEVFHGMDSALALDKKFNEEKERSLFEKYWDNDPVVRRKKLLPFLWTTLADNGQIYGNRDLGNFVDVSNPYWFSYPGYSEIFTGFVDTLINSNEYGPTPNQNVLAFLNQQKKIKGKVAAFGAWDAFDRILSKVNNGLPVFSGFDPFGGDHPTEREFLINQLNQDSYKIFGKEECPDVFTHYGAMEKLKREKLKVLYIAYGETDEFAHSGKYNSYLDAAHQFDQWVASIWKYLQSQPQYRNKTALFITTDHGRGDKLYASKWTSHGENVKGANEIWFAVMAPGVGTKGEVKEKMQVYQKQFAQTMASLLGLQFQALHPVADRIEAVFR